MMYPRFFFFSSRRRHTRLTCDWSSDVCSSDLLVLADTAGAGQGGQVGGELPVPVHEHGPQRPGRQRGLDHVGRSEERRVGKECRSRWVAYLQKKNRMCRVMELRLSNWQTRTGQ